MTATAQQSYTRPLVKAVAEGDSSPDPGVVGAVLMSSTTGALMRWTGAVWTRVGGHAIAATVDFGYASGGEGCDAHAVVAAPWVSATTVLVAAPAAAATPDHDPDDAWVEGVTASAGAPVAGVGFTVHATAPGNSWGRYLINVLAI